ncbi:MAG: hypothetical protein ACR2HJ_08705 [Fimbriimonadales bacterium]
MIIRSKYRDYYDSAQGYGQDPKLVYDRTVGLESHVDWTWDRKVADVFKLQSHRYYNLAARLVVIGFCGRIYPVWLARRFELTSQSLGSHTNEKHWLTRTELVAICVSEAPAQHRVQPNRERLDYVRERVESAYADTDVYSGSVINDTVFRDLNCPVFLAWDRMGYYTSGPYHILTNPRLATLGFMHQVDAFTAFQEIAMFLGSTLAQEPIAPNTVGDDRLIARSKGFDDQSFRMKAPGQKKLNRKANKGAKRRKEQGDTGLDRPS